MSLTFSRLLFALSIIAALFCAAPGHAQSVRSIQEWVKGDGRTDDVAGVAKAFDACKNNAFTLLVDCPVPIHVGRDVARPIFVDNGVHVKFTEQGVFIVDNVLQPCFVIANSSDVRFENWNVEYRGGLPMGLRTGGYYDNGRLVDKGGYASAVFNDTTLANWLKEHRGIAFGGRAANAEVWHGPTNLSAIFYLIGPTSNVVVDNMRLFAPSGALGSRFIPMAFSFTAGYDNNTTPVPVNGASLTTLPDISVPSNLTFHNIVLDGYYMGFQGTVHNATFSNITGLRYGDLQDDNGNDVGGDHTWFAPPHLFYLNNGDPKHPLNERFNNKNVAIADVNDIGPRIGRARDIIPERGSGCAMSLKIGAIDSSVTNYTSSRPDGLLDMLSCHNMTLTNIEATYDSSFVNDLYPGIRFPSGDYYQNLTIKDLTLTDTAADPYAHAPAYGSEGVPFSGAHGQNNSNIVFENVVVNLKKWSGRDLQPTFGGANNQTHVTFNIP